MKYIYLMITAGVLMLVCIILSIDRFRLNNEFYNIGIRINEKTEEIQQNREKYKATLNTKDQEIQKLKSRFQFVTEVKTLPDDPMLMQAEPVKNKKDTSAAEKKQTLEPFAQITADEKDLALIGEIVGKVQTPVTPENVRKTFLAYWQNEVPSGQFFPAADGLRIIDRDAAILEGVCRALHLKVHTVLYWNMEKMQRTAVSTIESPVPDDPAVSISCRMPPDPGSIQQTAAVSTVFPFEPVSLPDNTERELLLKFHEFPVGGLYLHKITLLQPADAKAEEWLLEYKFRPEQKIQAEEQTQIPQPVLQAVSLLPGKPVTSVLSKDRQTFRIPFCKGKSEVLVFGDRVILPYTVTALPCRAE